MTPSERQQIGKELRDRYYGRGAKDVREAERDAGRHKDLDDLEHLTTDVDVPGAGQGE